MLAELDLKAGHILISVSQGDIRFLNFHFGLRCRKRKEYYETCGRFAVVLNMERLLPNLVVCCAVLADCQIIGSLT